MLRDRNPRSANESSTRHDPACCEPSRRDFLRTVGATAAVSAGGILLPLGRAGAGILRPEDAKPAKPEKTSENWVAALHETLSADQKKVMHFPFDHEKRTYVANNWDIVDPAVGAIEKLYTADQQEIIHSIFKSLTTEDGYERFQKQMKDDAGGFGRYTCALFGEPGEKFEFVLTGRHLTCRVDGNSVEHAAFGGPIFYGHAVEFTERPDHPGNVWWHQSRLANEVFQALDGEQRKKATLNFSPEDNAEVIRLPGHDVAIAGLRCAELSADQKGLVKKTLESLLGMFRKSDVDEVMKCLEANGGLDEFRMSFFKEGDLGDDGIWDRWKVEGPTFAWYFRGSPHVHVWVNVASAASTKKAATL
jgi:hypothetical protein